MALFRPLTASKCNDSAYAFSEKGPTEAVPPGVGVQPASAPATSTTGTSATVPTSRRVVRDHDVVVLLPRRAATREATVQGPRLSPASMTTPVRCSVMV